jgi:hypothetical protein
MSHHAFGRRGPPAPLVGAVAGGVTLLVLATAFSLHALDVPWAWVVYPLGFGGLLPLATGVAARAGCGAEREPRPERRGADGRGRHGQAVALEDLRLRYARGELDEAAFERRLERLLSSEASEGVSDHYGEAYSAGGETPSASTTRSR